MSKKCKDPSKLKGKAFWKWQRKKVEEICKELHENEEKQKMLKGQSKFSRGSVTRIVSVNLKRLLKKHQMRPFLLSCKAGVSETAFNLLLKGDVSFDVTSSFVEKIAVALEEDALEFFRPPEEKEVKPRE